MRPLFLAFILFVLSCSNNEQQFQNLEFDLSCSLDSEECVWKKSWGKEDCCIIETVGENSFLTLVGKKADAVSFIEQELILPKRNDMRVITVSSLIKTKTVEGKGAGLNIGIYDMEGSLIATKDMGGYYSLDWEKGNNDWKKTSISVVGPSDAHKVKIGAILYGAGEAHFDNFDVQFIDINSTKNINASPYITNAIDIVRHNSLVRDSVDFDQLKAKASLIAEAAGSTLAVQYIIDGLKEYGDHHSFLMSPQESKSWEEDDEPEGKVDFPTVTIEENIGIVNVPAFHSGNKKLMLDFAERLQQGLKSIYSKKLKGWIVDLRLNTGGNMEPMIAGLGPLFDSGNLGSLLDINGNNEYWRYENGAYYSDEQKGTSLDEPFLLDKKLPIVVLTNEQTGSSGEVVVISFIGNTKTILMGKPTWGLTTGNGEFELEDGLKMFMASTKMVDRNGDVYASQIQPDIVIEKDEELMPAAKKWINENQ